MEGFITILKQKGGVHLLFFTSFLLDPSLQPGPSKIGRFKVSDVRSHVIPGVSDVRDTKVTIEFRSTTGLKTFIEETSVLSLRRPSRSYF